MAPSGDCPEIQPTLDRVNQLGPPLAGQSPAERRQTKETYRAVYGEDLIENLYKAQLVNPNIEVCNILYLWMLDPNERDAVLAHNSLAGIEPDYVALIEIYTGRKSNQIFITGQVYLGRFRRHLNHDLASPQQAHPYQKILVALASSHRSHYVELSEHIAKCDAQRLNGARRSGAGGAVDEAVILEMLSKRSIAQLRLAFSCYKCIYGQSFTKALKESRGEFGESLRVVIKCMHHPAKHYSKMLNANLKGSRIRLSALSRLMIHSKESGMEEIKEAFVKKYGSSLRDAIEGSIAAGKYREFLVYLTQ